MDGEHRVDTNGDKKAETESDYIGFQGKVGCSCTRHPGAFGDGKASEWQMEAVPGPVPSDLS